MLWRRFAHGFWPLLVWARDEDAADVTASIHASLLGPVVVVLPFGYDIVECDPEL